MLILGRINPDVEEINKLSIERETEKFMNQLIGEIGKDRVKIKDKPEGMKLLKGEKYSVAGLRKAAEEVFIKDHEIHGKIDELENIVTDYRDLILNFQANKCKENDLTKCYDKFIENYDSFTKEFKERIKYFEEMGKQSGDHELIINAHKLDDVLNDYIMNTKSDIKRMKRIVEEEKIKYIQTPYHA